MNYYEILEVSENASAEVIKASYRALAKKYHPDVFQGDKDEASEQFKMIAKAYEVLSDPQKKLLYDAYLRVNTNSTNSSSFYDETGTTGKSQNGYRNNDYNSDASKGFNYQETKANGDNNITEDENRTNRRFILVYIVAIIAVVIGAYFYLHNDDSQIMSFIEEEYPESYMESEANSMGAQVCYGWEITRVRAREESDTIKKYYAEYKYDVDDTDESNGYSLFPYEITTYKDEQYKIQYIPDNPEIDSWYKENGYYE